MKVVEFGRQRKRQKRCYRKGRRKNRNHGYDEALIKGGEIDELWENDNSNRYYRDYHQPRRRRLCEERR